MAIVVESLCAGMTVGAVSGGVAGALAYDCGQYATLFDGVTEVACVGVITGGGVGEGYAAVQLYKQHFEKSNTDHS